MTSTTLACLSGGSFILILAFTVIQPVITNFVLSYGVIPLTLPVIEIPNYCQNWFVASMLVNVISIVFTVIYLYMNRKKMPDYSIIHNAFLGALAVTNVFCLSLAKYNLPFLPIVLTTIIFLVYLVLDFAGLKRDAGDQRFKVPLFSIDLPSFVVSAFFLYYAWRIASVTYDFLTGISAAILLTGNIMFTFVYAFLIDDEAQEGLT